MKFRSFISAALALMLVLTSQGMTVARSSPDATGQMVLCVGSETVVVYTDADGAPTSAPHFCPDCALHLDFVAAAPQLTAPQRVTSVYRANLTKRQIIPARKGYIPQSRAPPVVV